MFGRVISAALLALTGAAAPARAPEAPAPATPAQWAAQCKDWDEWDKPAPPFRVLANTYYVGTCGISSILITGSKGDILIDGGPADAGGLIARNVEALGFKLSDVKILLHTHEHHDHVGGLAELERLTGARLLASPAATSVLESGKAGPGDPQFADHKAFPPAHVNGQVRDGDVVRLGDLAIHAVATPGHTPGAMSWYWDVWFSGDLSATIVYADSLMPVSSDGYRFTDHPEIVADFRSSLAKIANLNCRYLLSPHPSASGMRTNIVAHGRIAASRTACKDYAQGLETELDERLAKEAHGG